MTILSENKSYWTGRAAGYSEVNQLELSTQQRQKWSDCLHAEITRQFPDRAPESLRVLEVGTGPGFFAILLCELGYNVTAIDLTPAMLEEAKNTAHLFGADVTFMQMDVMGTDFAENSFDVIVMRNVTWTLPDPEKAYREWHRILRPGGMLLNFDANYADNVRNQNQRESWVKPEDVYGHVGITKELSEENARITLSMPASDHHRPQWDAQLTRKIRFSEWGADEQVGKRVLLEHDLSDAPLFLFWARK